MKTLFQIVLYTALVFGANASLADLDTAKALRTGDMKKLVFHEAPQEVSSTEFETIDGGTGTLADYDGKVVVLTFWATWCAPCKKEMPGLERLNTALGGDDFAVVTLATGRNSVNGIARFFGDKQIASLPQYRDIKQGIAREMSIPGLPTTVILDRQGREIARLIGDAEWDTPSAKAILSALIFEGADS